MNSKFFIDIGSADFGTLVQLAENGWSGIVVEPIPHFHENLKDLFCDKPVEILELAISDTSGKMPMIVSTGGGWARGVSHSMSPNHKGTKLSTLAGNENIFGDTIEVDCITLDQLVNVYVPEQMDIDFLKIDAEGHETNIIEAYTWNKKPSFLKIEHKHIDDLAMKATLEAQGYLVWTEQDDIYAVC
ncbi:MAG: FkbM family methyltransferase [Betaproteobacteria bacterium]